MVKKTVSVSIVAANYNNGIYLKDFVNSILASTVLPVELIVVDDGSTDNSLEILNSFSRLPFFKLISFKNNKGFCHALNAGIEAATGDYIMRADPDDIILESRIEAQTSFLQDHDDIDVVGSNVIYFNSETGKDLIKSNFPLEHHGIKKEYLNGDHGIQHPTTLIRAQVMKQYRYVQENVLAEDYEIFAKMIKDGHRFANIKDPLLRMRIHAGSAGSNIKFDVIKKTFQLRDMLFNTLTSRAKVRCYYFYMLNFRRFLLSNSTMAKWGYLTLAVLCQPQKLVKRIVKSL